MKFDILFYAMLSRLAYKGYDKKKDRCDKNKLTQRIVEYLTRKNMTNFKIIKIIEKKGLLCFILKKDNEVYVAFRGTVSGKNWLTNINVRRKKVKLGKVHKGFYKGAKLLYDEIIQYIDKENDIINMSSHSLGSALSFLSSNMLYENGYKLNNIVCFECPNFGSKKYIKKTDSYKFNRLVITNNLDGVSMIPLLLSKYKINTLYFNRNGECNLNLSGFNVLTDRILTLKNIISVTELWTDHDMSNVLNLCWKNKNIIDAYIQEGLI